MSVGSATMSGMDFSAILTCAAAFIGGFAGSVLWYLHSQRRRSFKDHVPGPSPWPVEPLPRITYEKIPDGAITSGTIPDGVFTHPRGNAA